MLFIWEQKCIEVHVSQKKSEYNEILDTSINIILQSFKKMNISRGPPVISCQTLYWLVTRKYWNIKAFQNDIVTFYQRAVYLYKCTYPYLQISTTFFQLRFLVKCSSPVKLRELVVETVEISLIQDLSSLRHKKKDFTELLSICRPLC